MLPQGWRLTTIGEFCTYYKGGTPFEKLEYAADGIPVLAKGDIKRFGRLEHSGTRFVDWDLVRHRNFYTTLPGDFLMTTRDLTLTGDVLGLMARVPEDQPYLVNQGVNIVRLSDGVIWDYIIYWTNSPVYRAHMKAHAVGSTQIHIRKDAFIGAPLWLPPQSEQQRIVSMLGALDGMIDAYQRTAETLEKLMRALFRSWFIDFDPVHDKMAGRRPAHMDDDIAKLFPKTLGELETGAVRLGWRRGVLGEIAYAPRRGVQPSEIDPQTAYIGLEHMPRRRIALSEWGSAEDVTSGKSRFSRGDILFGKLRPYFHKVGVAPLDGVCSTDIIVITPSQPEYFGLALCHASSDAMIQHTDASSSGTKMPRTSWHDLSRFGIMVPPITLASAFTAKIRPLVELIISNIHEGRVLVELRDSLLPRLLSGELRVSDAERQVEAVA